MPSQLTEVSFNQSVSVGWPESLLAREPHFRVFFSRSHYAIVTLQLGSRMPRK